METGEQVEYFTRLDNPTLKLTYQMTQNNKFELVAAVQSQVAAVSQRQRVRAARSDAEPDRVDGDRPGVKWTHIINQTHDVRCGLQPLRLLVAGLRVDRRRADDRPDDDADARRVPRAAARAGALGLQRHVELVHEPQEHEPRDQVRVPRLHAAPTTSRPTAIPNQQIYRYRSLPGDTDLLPASRLGAGVRLSERHQRRRQLQLLVRQRHDHADAAS